jgi:hypothetical protein
MNLFNENSNVSKSKTLSTTFKLLLVSVILILLTIAFAMWGYYLNHHFVGSFDEYGIPSEIFHSGWDIGTQEWPVWVIPSFFFLALFALAFFLISDYLSTKIPKQDTHKAEETIVKITEAKQLNFTRALELEELKQQVDILKHKYFEEHHKVEEANRNVEQMNIALAVAQKETAAALTAVPKKTEEKKTPVITNAHNEAVISSLKADNRKLHKQITELQEDLEQSNALIEKLLETRGG